MQPMKCKYCQSKTLKIYVARIIHYTKTKSDDGTIKKKKVFSMWTEQCENCFANKHKNQNPNIIIDEDDGVLEKWN